MITTASATSAGSHSYDDDVRNRLKKVSTTSYADGAGVKTTRVWYTYDAEDRMVGRGVNETNNADDPEIQQHFDYDGVNPVLMYQDGAIITRYLHGLNEDKRFRGTQLDTAVECERLRR
jgi:hypothetical protein